MSTKHSNLSIKQKGLQTDTHDQQLTRLVQFFQLITP